MQEEVSSALSAVEQAVDWRAAADGRPQLNGKPFDGHMRPPMETIPPHQTYLALMQTVRGRLELIDQLKRSRANEFVRAESAAFQGRKIVEAIAFGCLVAVQNGLNVVPRDAEGQWNAAEILRNLERKDLQAFPEPGIIREATPRERTESRVDWVVEAVTDRRLTRQALIDIYQRLHAWLHEANPYIHGTHSEFYAQRSAQLWEDLSRLRLFIEKHFITIRGAGFFSITHDRDGQTRVIGINKVADVRAVEQAVAPADPAAGR